MTRTMRIWQRRPHPDRIPFFSKYARIYQQDKARIGGFNHCRRIRKEWWRKIRRQNKMICKQAGHFTDDYPRADPLFEIEMMEKHIYSRYSRPTKNVYFD